MSSPFPPGSLILPYLRDSGGSDQDASIDRQRAEITKWASENQLVIPRWFFDAAKSGRSTAGRDDFLKLMEYLTEKKRPEKGIVFWRYSRLARDFDDAMFYLAELRRRGYVAWSIVDAIPDTLEGRLMESVIAWKDAKYSADLAEDVTSGVHYVISVHHAYPNNTIKIGYRKEPITINSRRDGRPHTVHRLIPDPEKAARVLKAFQLRADGQTYSEIHKEVRLTLSSDSLGKLLRDSIYIGVLQYGGCEYPDFCEPIVPREIWDAAQTVNKARQTRAGYNHPRAARSRFLLSGLLYCTVCGSRMRGITSRDRGKTYLYYRCGNYLAGVGKSACKSPKLPKEETEKVVIDALMEKLLDRERLAPLIREAMAGLERRATERDEQLAVLQAQSREVERGITNLTKAVRESGHSRAMLAELGRLESERDELAARIASHAFAAPPTAGVVDVDEWIADAAQKLQGDPVEQAALLRGVVVQVLAARDKGMNRYYNRQMPIRAEIKYHIPFTETVDIISV